jgi:uncharacterized protein YqeY
MSQKDKLQQDMKTAMKARDELRTSTIRLAISAVRNTEIDKGHELNDQEVIEVLAKEAKMRREAVEGAEKAGRPDVAERENKELEILSEYLPKQLSEAEITEIVEQVVAETGATGMSDRGKVMSALMPRIKGRADGKLASQVVEQILRK